MSGSGEGHMVVSDRRPTVVPAHVSGETHHKRQTGRADFPAEEDVVSYEGAAATDSTLSV